MTSNIASHALSLCAVLPHNVDMPRKARPKHADRRPTFIRSWRKHRGYTQARLSDILLHESEIELSEGQLSRIESGKQPYSQDLMEAIAKALACEVVDLLIRDPTAPDPIWSVWDTLRPSERAQAVEVIKALKRTGTGG